MSSVNPAIALEIDMAAAGNLNPFSQQGLTLPLQVGPGEGDIAMAIDDAMPGKGRPFRQAPQYATHLTRCAR